MSRIYIYNQNQDIIAEKKEISTIQNNDRNIKLEDIN